MRQLNIRVTPEQYEVLKNLAKAQEFRTFPNAVASKLLHDVLNGMLKPKKPRKHKAAEASAPYPV